MSEDTNNQDKELLFCEQWKVSHALIPTKDEEESEDRY